MSSWIPIFLACIAIICAILGKMGYTGREKVIGIDLGTTYSVVGVYRKGKVEIIKDTIGRPLTPSVVAFKKNEIVVGYPARDYIKIDSTQTIFNAKRFIGRNYNDSFVQEEAKLYDFTLKKDKTSEKICYNIKVSENKNSNACISPITIGSFIIKDLKKKTAKYLGHNQVSSVVIAVPAEFDAIQRKATAEAFENAGLRVIRVLDEPTAAAIAYGLDKDPNVHFIIVFDFGGGTLDVSLLYIHNNGIQVIDTAGDNTLGGEDIDNVLAVALKEKFKKILGKDIIHHSHPHTTDDTNEKKNNLFPCTASGIRAAAEGLKRELSKHTIANVSCIVQEEIHSLAENNKILFKDGSIITITMNRDEFESICQVILNKTIEPINIILQGNKMSTKDIDEVVLVGGSSRIPWIRRNLKKMFNNKEPNTHIDPDIAIAYGAARTVD